MTSEEELEKCLHAAYRLLKYRPRSRKEVEEGLRRRGFSAEAIERTVSRLDEEGLLNDHHFARAWVESRQSLNPKSRRLLELELKSKGVPSEAIAEAMIGVDDEETAYHLGLKKARKLTAADYVTFRQRLGAYLARRGYSWDVIARAVKRVWHETRNSSV